MYSTEGIVLKRIDVGESDSLFTIYTKDFGKIRARAQSVKKEGAKLRGHLETLSHANISFVIGKNGERLTGASLLNFWPGTRGDYNKTAVAFYTAELFDKYCMNGEKDEALWELLVSSLNGLNAPDFSKDFLDDFEDKFMAALGYSGRSDLGNMGVSIMRPSMI